MKVGKEIFASKSDWFEFLEKVALALYQGDSGRRQGFINGAASEAKKNKSESLENVFVRLCKLFAPGELKDIKGIEDVIAELQDAISASRTIFREIILEALLRQINEDLKAALKPKGPGDNN